MLLWKIKCFQQENSKEKSHGFSLHIGTGITGDYCGHHYFKTLILGIYFSCKCSINLQQ